MKYTNGYMNLTEVFTLFNKQYSIFRNNKSNGFIVAWLPKFEEKTVTWSQGHYDMTLTEAFQYTLKYGHDKLVDEDIFYMLDMNLIDEYEATQLYKLVE